MINEATRDDVRQLILSWASKYNVRVLFAVEAGSRVWDFDNIASDYDVRGVFVGSLDTYLGIQDPPHTLAITQPRANEPTIEICLWDIKKFVNLLLRSNPSVSEWLQSPFPYHDEFYYQESMRETFNEGFSPSSLLTHYIGMARQNYEKYIRNKEVVEHKRYLYVLRALGCVQFIENAKVLPPLNYKELRSCLPQYVYDFMDSLVKAKNEGHMPVGPAAHDINEYIELCFQKQFPKQPSRFDVKAWNNTVVRIIKDENKS